MQQESESKSLKDKYKYNLYWVMSCKFAPPTGGFGLQCQHQRQQQQQQRQQQ